MTLLQLKALISIVESNMRVSQAADNMNTVQSAVSRHLALLEDNLGVAVFERRGKRLLRLTPAGREILQEARNVLRGTQNIARIGDKWRDPEHGVLRLATTHTQAKYFLPAVIDKLRKKFPLIKLRIIQGSPQELIEKIDQGQADLAICTEVLADISWLQSRVLTKWTHALVTKRSHKLAEMPRVLMRDISSYPVITYDFGFTGRGAMQQLFKSKNIELDPILTAIDTDIIKTYVRSGLGVGIIAQVAFTPKQDFDLKMIPIEDYGLNFTTKVAWHKDAYLPKFILDAIEMLRAHGEQQSQMCIAQQGD